MSVSWTTGWPSAVTAIQEFSEARITKVRLATGLRGGGLASSASGCIASSLALEALAALVVAGDCEEVDEEEAVGEPG
jgi:hypothetical protein